MSAPQSTAFNMHTDMVIGSDDHGYWLTGKNPAGTSLSVRVTEVIAERIGIAAGGTAAPTPDPQAPVPVNPDNMHTDSQTSAKANQTNTKITVIGPASTPTGDTQLTLSITGTALTYTKDASV